MDTVSQKIFKEAFLLETFFNKTESKDVASTKTRKTAFLNQSDSAVCNPPRSQAPRWVGRSKIS